MTSPLFRKVDCLSLPVNDLERALRFYRDALGHELVWRDETAAGLRLPDSNAELVLHTDERPIETDLSVESVPDAIDRFTRAGGSVAVEPFEIRIGRCAIVTHQPLFWDAYQRNRATGAFIIIDARSSDRFVSR